MLRTLWGFIEIVWAAVLLLTLIVITWRYERRKARRTPRGRR